MPAPIDQDQDQDRGQEQEQGRDREFQEDERDSDTSTDSIDLGSAARARTQPWESDTPRGRRRAKQRGELEANVILIFHPQSKMLGTRFRLARGSTIEIGRAPGAEIQLPDVMALSRNHARLIYGDQLVTIEDLGSTNGTFVNDRPIDGPTVLTSGDRFQVGGVHFKFLHERDPEHAYHEAIYQLVVRDGLTEAFNRRQFEEDFEREFSRATRYERPLALILLDIDHFKRVNDSHGHLCGDLVLKQIAARCRDLLRPEQVFARVGGEEFVILCPETGGEGAAILAEKLRERIAGEAFECSGASISVTCSFGVAELGPEMAGAEELYGAADRALYASKEGGRNLVTFRPVGPLV